MSKKIGLRHTTVLVLERSGGICERCQQEPAAQYHHRQPRGMGGSRDPWQHSPANLLHLCLDCHRWVEGNSRAAYKTGFKVRHGAKTPTETPLRRKTDTVFLRHDGTVFRVD